VRLGLKEGATAGHWLLETGTHSGGTEQSEAETQGCRWHLDRRGEQILSNIAQKPNAIKQ